MARLCARPGCAASAAATMTYDYGERTAWLDDLTGEPSPAAYDLCPHHADRLAVPQGWTRTDRRRLELASGAASFELPPLAPEPELRAS